MKCFIGLIFILSFSSVFAEEKPVEKPLDLTYRPTQGDLKAFMNSATQKMAAITRPTPASGCRVIYDPANEVVMEGEYVCMHLPEKTIKNWILAHDDDIDCEAQQNNDANPLEIKDEKNPNAKNLSDDVGYSLAVLFKCSRENKNRKLTASLGSILYTQKVPGPDGKAKTPDGRINLKTFEQTYTKFTVEEKTSDPSTRIVGEVGLRYQTDSSKGIASQIQSAWHDNLDRYSNLRYAKEKGSMSELTADMKIGIKKMAEAEVSNFYCSIAGTGMVGLDTQGKGIIATKIEAEVNTGNMGGRDKDTPLFALQLAQEQELRGRDRTSTTELKVSSTVYADKQGHSVNVGVGRVVHRSKEYTAYTPKEEPIYSVFIKYRKAFKGL